MENVDLEDILSRRVIADAVPVFDNTVDGDNDDEIQKVEFHQVDPAEYNENNNQNGKYHDDEAYQQPTESFMSPEDIAENIVNLLDGLQSSIIPYLREKKIFNEKELEQLAKLDKNAAYDVNSKEYALVSKWHRHQQIIKTIPFDEGETIRLKAATASYAATTNMKVTPLQGLIMAYSEVVIKRVPIFMAE
jgi:hypothetical protein